jgi:hypothetical protein
MEDLTPKPLSALSDTNSLMLLGVVVVIAGIVVGFLVRDYVVTKRRERRFYAQRRRAQELVESSDQKAETHL